MKTQNIILSLTAVAFLAFAGCNKNSDNGNGTTPPSDVMTNSTGNQNSIPTMPTTNAPSPMLSTNAAVGTNSTAHNP